MARMLGVAVGNCDASSSSSAADFELVTRLEKLILANQTSVTGTLPVDSAFSDLAAAYRSRTGLTAASPSPSNQLHHDDDDDDDDDDDEVPDSSRSYKGHSARTRSRSLSPMRTRDHNVY